MPGKDDLGEPVFTNDQVASMLAVVENQIATRVLTSSAEVFEKFADGLQRLTVETSSDEARRGAELMRQQAMEMARMVAAEMRERAAAAGGRPDEDAHAGDGQRDQTQHQGEAADDAHGGIVARGQGPRQSQSTRADVTRKGVAGNRTPLTA
jgi:hypothetical protein